MKNMLSFFAIAFLLFSCSSSNSDDAPNTSYSLPTIVFNTVSEITRYSASGTAYVSNDGGAPILARGLCWSTTPNPTITNFNANDGVGVGAFEGHLNELSNATTYYVRAYATNHEGTGYSEELTFTTLDCNFSTYEGNVTLISQHEVDEFGLLGHEKINGSLILGEDNLNPMDPILNLKPLSCLQEVTGSLSIMGNPHLKDVDELTNLTSIGHSLIVSNNAFLNNIEGLSSVTSSIKNLTITSLGSLEDLSGLENINEIEESIEISFNNSLLNIDDLIDIDMNSVSFEIKHNLVLQSFSGLDSVTIIKERFYIANNAALTDLSGLDNLVLVDGDMYINDNPNLETIHGLEKLEEISDRFFIQTNPELEKLDGLEVLLKTGNIDINTNISLVNFCGLTNLFNIGSHSVVLIYDNAYNPSEQNLIDGNCSQ